MKKLRIRTGLAVLYLWLLVIPVLAAQKLVPVGQVIGLELTDGTVTVAAFADTLGEQARAAGLKVRSEERR